MPDPIKVKKVMIPLEDYPHIPYWFTLRQAMAIVRKAAIKSGGYLPRSILIFDEKYQIVGLLTLRDIIKGLKPRILLETEHPRPEDLATPITDLFDPGMEEALQKPVSEFMSPVRVMVGAEDPIAKALFLMMKENVGMMPVMQEKKLAGMIRLSDIFKVISTFVLGE